MFGLLVLALLVLQCMAGKAADSGPDADMWAAFAQLEPEMERSGMTREEAMGRIDIFKRNYEAFVEHKSKVGEKNIALNMMAFLNTEEMNDLIDENNKINQARAKRVRRSANANQRKADVADLLVSKKASDYFNKGPVPNQFDTTKLLISKTAKGFPDTDRDMSAPADFAFAAAWTMDVLDVLYRDPQKKKTHRNWALDEAPQEWIKKKRCSHLSPPPTGTTTPTLGTTSAQPTTPTGHYKTPTYGHELEIKRVGRDCYKRWATPWMRHSVSRAQLMNCVYKDNGLKTGGSPADAFQWMSDNTVVMSMRQKPHGVTIERGGLYVDDGDRFEKMDDIIQVQVPASLDPSCVPNTNASNIDLEHNVEPNDMYAMLHVAFLPGKAYVPFGDDIPTSEIINKPANTYADVMGEKLVKPLVYRTGAVLVRMPYCYFTTTWNHREIGKPYWYKWSEYNFGQGVYNFDCSKDKLIYNDVWAVIIGYSRTWIRIGGLPETSSYSASTEKTLIVSRLASDRHVVHWDQLILPRVKKYVNCGCQNGGRCTADNTCYCPLNKVGATCADDCTLNCQNGGYCRGSATQCHCPKGFYGAECTSTCNCGKFGTCDSDGICSCPRQVAYGKNCENSCDCGGVSGYCHEDGKCECLAGKSGPKCQSTCTKSCKSPKVCRASKVPDLSVDKDGNHINEFCDCPFGFRGDNCDEKIRCDIPDTATFAKCQEMVDRHRCNNDDNKNECPHACGHCLWLRQSGTADTKK